MEGAGCNLAVAGSLATAFRANCHWLLTPTIYKPAQPQDRRWWKETAISFNLDTYRVTSFGVHRFYFPLVCRQYTAVSFFSFSCRYRWKFHEAFDHCGLYTKKKKKKQRKVENDVRANLWQPRNEVLLMQNFRVKKHVITSFYLEPFITRIFTYIASRMLTMLLSGSPTSTENASPSAQSYWWSYLSTNVLSLTCH